MSKLTHLEHLKSAAQAAKNYVDNLIVMAANAIDEVENAKADRPQAQAITIPTSGWSSDSTAGWPKYYDISAAGVTAADRVEITLAPAGLEAAKSCDLCPTCETLSGKIRIRSASVPASAIQAEYWIEDGKE